MTPVDSTLSSSPQKTNQRSRRARILAGSVGLVAASFFAWAGCVDNEGSFYILAAVSVDSTTHICAADSCSGYGLVSTGGGGACVQIVSQLISRAATDHVETNRIIFKQVDITINNGTSDVDTFSQPIAGFVDPGTETTPTTLSIPLIEASTKLTSGKNYLAEIVLEGRTLGGIDLKTPAFDLAFVPLTSAQDPCNLKDASGKVTKSTSCCASD